ncbi:hypothetical protein ACMA1I_15850 [Pontibacter sp. 13R65]|uniref:hypothetical protein n=1 Tax=Pontibacter sp. 13R65 TaxID=3127458 RepID=UPI00301D3685
MKACCALASIWAYKQKRATFAASALVALMISLQLLSYMYGQHGWQTVDTGKIGVFAEGRIGKLALTILV